MSLAVFGYASLVSRESAAETLGRPVGECPVARLVGWRRRWSLVRDNLRSEKSFADAGNGSTPPFILGLNIEQSDDPGEAPNGVLIELSEAELERLDLREIRYRRVDVSEQIEAGDAASFETVVAYTARPDNFASSPPPGAVVLESYVQTVERCFAELGTGQRELYLETTGAPPVEVITAKLVRDEIPPGNPRAW
ncbi:MAG: gamma-glutamylcyclotransferase family protein [Solirubrobacterales bacterium]